MIEVKTKKGFVVTVNEAILDDMELLDDLTMVDSDASYLPKIITRMLGVEQKKALYDYYRSDDGVVHTTVIMDVLSEIFDLIPEAKK